MLLDGLGVNRNSVDSGIDIDELAGKIVKKLVFNPEKIKEYLLEKRIISADCVLSHIQRATREPFLFCQLVDEINALLGSKKLATIQI